MRWCPAPDCGHAVKVQYYDSQPVTCDCGQTFWYCIFSEYISSLIVNFKYISINKFKIVHHHNNAFMTWCLYTSLFCNCSFSCGENWHDPVKCYWLRQWIKKCDDDSETSNWIAANTKVT